MAMWLYQLSQKPEEEHPPTQYRLDIWENEPWYWHVGKKRNVYWGDDRFPDRGDIVVLYYSGTGTESGFYGWAVVLQWEGDSLETRRLHFRPVAPSDSLKMCPWNDKAAKDIADKIRGDNKQLTLYIVPEATEQELRQGIISWPSRAYSAVEQDLS